MNQKSTRGVQQDEVSAAADTLLAECLRPTIERVRMKIGRGSPNTVAPMLETWFADLGVRLGVAPIAEGEGGRTSSGEKLPDLMLLGKVGLKRTLPIAATIAGEKS
jgi:hypothetical protein